MQRKSSCGGLNLLILTCVKDFPCFFRYLACGCADLDNFPIIVYEVS